MKHETWRGLGLLIASIFCAAGVVYASANFSGTWNLNMAKSDFNPASGLTKMTSQIEQRGEDLTVRTRLVDHLGDRSERASYRLDGRVNKNSDGVATESTASWDGDTLVFNVKQGIGLAYKERWSLSDDGKTLIIKRHTIFARSEVTEEYVFDKQ
jgi:hypothetical protein